jgi:Uma2 family endonuclease
MKAMALDQAVLDEKLITGEMLYRMPEIGPCELVEGRLLMKSPTGERHGAMEMNLAAALKAYTQARGSGKVRVGEVGIYIRHNPDTVRAADVLYISNERYDRHASSGFLDVAPELVVEVLPPEDRWSEVTRKLDEYFSIGVLRVWVADPVTQSIFVYHSATGVGRFTENDTLADEELLPGFSMPVEEVFRE